MISLPCSSEAPEVNGAKVALKLTSSCKVLGKDLNQSAVQRVPAKAGENGRVDSGAEGCGSSSQAGTTLSPERQAVRSEVAKQGNNCGNEANEYYALYALLPLLFGEINGVRRMNAFFVGNLATRS